MKKKIILHTGVHRTGSTSIQRALASSRGIIRSHGVIYPKLFGDNDHVQIPWMLMKKKISSDDLLAEIDRCDDKIANTIVLSAEDFCLMSDLTFIEVLKRKYDVNVVMYFKEQVSWLESWYNQNIKWPWNRKFSSATPEEFVSEVSDFYWIDYMSTLNNFLRFVDLDDIYFDVLGKNGVEDTVSDFMNRINIDPIWLNSFSNQNESLSYAKLQVLSSIDLLSCSGKQRVNILKALDDVKIDGDDGSKLVFSTKQCVYLEKYFASSNKELAIRYFNRDQLFVKKDYASRAINNIDESMLYAKYIPELIKKLSN